MINWINMTHEEDYDTDDDVEYTVINDIALGPDGRLWQVYYWTSENQEWSPPPEVRVTLEVMSYGDPHFRKVASYEDDMDNYLIDNDGNPEDTTDNDYGCGFHELVDLAGEIRKRMRENPMEFTQEMIDDLIAPLRTKMVL